MIIERNERIDGIKIGDLEYGSIITGIKGSPRSIYIKIKKRCGVGVHLNYTRDHCVLVNLQHGTVREIPGDSYVTVLDSKLIINDATNPFIYKKE